MSGEIKRVVQVSATGGKKERGDELVFMMHLLKRVNGPTALLKFLHDSNPRDLPFLTSYKDKLIVGYGFSVKGVHVHLCVFVCVLICVWWICMYCMYEWVGGLVCDVGVCRVCSVGTWMGVVCVV